MAKAFYFEKMMHMKFHFAGKQTHSFHIVTEVHDPYLVHLRRLYYCRFSAKITFFEFSFYGISLLE